MLKALIIFVLAVVVFGSGAYWTYELFLRPGQDLKEERSMPPPPPPPDPALPDFERAVKLHKGLQTLDARAAFERFIEQYPQSSKVEEAKELLGEINTSLFLNPVVTPEKEIYVVKSGDVLNKVAARMKTTPELIMRANHLNGTILRIGQKLLVAPGSFSVVINKRQKRVTLLKNGKFFKQYAIRTMPPSHSATPKKSAGAPTPAPKLLGKITEKIAWAPTGQRVTFADKEYAEAAHWIVFNLGGNTLYSDPDPNSGRTMTKPPQGLGLAPEQMDELAALLRKGDPVTIEP